MGETLIHNTNSSKLTSLIERHPIVTLTALFMLVAGVACGVSTSLMIGDVGFVGYACEALKADNVNAFHAILRQLFFNAAVIFAVLSSMYIPLMYPIACFGIMVKGCFMGMAAGALIAENGLIGIVFALCTIVIPAVVTITGLYLSFICASSKIGDSAKKGAKESHSIYYCCMLLLMGSIIESALQILVTMLFL